MEAVPLETSPKSLVLKPVPSGQAVCDPKPLKVIFITCKIFSATFYGRKGIKFVKSVTKKKQIVGGNIKKEADWLFILRGKNQVRARQPYYPQFPSTSQQHACAKQMAERKRRAILGRYFDKILAM